MSDSLEEAAIERRMSADRAVSTSDPMDARPTARWPRSGASTRERIPGRPRQQHPAVQVKKSVQHGDTSSTIIFVLKVIHNGRRTPTSVTRNSS
jgi:hypothetical protein